jgi:hypothetical protein
MEEWLGLLMLNDDQMLLSWQRQGKAGEFLKPFFVISVHDTREDIFSE